MRIAIVGYGRLGRAAEICAARAESCEVLGIFTRRGSEGVSTLGARAYPLSDIYDHQGSIDCVLVCQGSSGDTPSCVPRLAECFCTVDSYDRHRDIPRHRAAVDAAARRGGFTSLVSVGWDPGLLSLIRIYSMAFMQDGVVNTFWGRGLSQGHTEALKRISGVRDAVQYTLPRDEAILLAEGGVRLTDRERHRRVCYVSADVGERERIEREIRNTEDYFKGYEVEINFVSEEELHGEHGSQAHCGRVISIGRSGVYRENTSRLSFSLELDSNPEFTASVMLASASAALRMQKEGRLGAYTLSDVAPSYLLPIGKCEFDYL